jgi:hypothetical protein
MKRNVIGTLVGFIAASALAFAQGTTPPAPRTPAEPQQPASKEITVTGCVTQGSSPTVFVLDNARQKPEDRSEKAASYILIASGEDLNFKTYLNQEVQVTGAPKIKTAPAPAPPAGQKAAEKDLPKFSAKMVTTVSDRCTTH